MAAKKVLIVDNDNFFLETLGNFLTEKGYAVRKAADGLEALEKVKEEPPDFILLDIILPKIDGGRVCFYLRQDPQFQNIPILVFSGLAARDILKIPEISADAYIAKGPFGIVANNILAALKLVEEKGRTLTLEESVFGYDAFRPRQLVTELLTVKRHYELLLRYITEGIVEVDSRGKIIYINPAGLKMVRRPEKTLIGSEVISLFGSQPSFRSYLPRIDL